VVGVDRAGDGQCGGRTDQTEHGLASGRVLRGLLLTADLPSADAGVLAADRFHRTVTVVARVGIEELDGGPHQVHRGEDRDDQRDQTDEVEVDVAQGQSLLDGHVSSFVAW